MLDNQVGSELSIHERLNALHAEQSGLPTGDALQADEATPDLELEAEEAEELEEESEDEQIEEEEDSRELETANPTEESETETEAEPKQDEEEQQLGYLREKDYRQKTITLAARNRELDEKTTAIDNQLGQLGHALEMTLRTTDLQELKELDPEGYIRKKDEIDEKVKQYNELKATQQRRQAEQYQEFVATQVQRLPEVIPQWLDKAVASKELKSVRAHLMDNGYSEQEAYGTVDHRAVVMARKAMLYDQIMASDPSKKKVIKTPKSAKPTRPRTNSEKRTAKSKAKRGRLKKTGTVDDAQAAIKDLLFS